MNALFKRTNKDIQPDGRHCEYKAESCKPMLDRFFRLIARKGTLSKTHAAIFVGNVMAVAPGSEG